MIKLIIMIILSYFLGAISFSYLITKIYLKKDIRELGSKNAGATNVFRSVGKIPGILTLILDILKGFFVVKISYIFFPNSLIHAIIFGCITIISHSFSIFLNFKGGKSVATTLGVFCGIAPLAIFIALIIFIACLGFFGFVSLSSIIAAFCLPFIIYSLKYNSIILIMAIFIAIFVIYRHKSNIKRLYDGTEKKIIG
jgi:acyl phosphate:glycerol-3-phosphate acyltransferase